MPNSSQGIHRLLIYLLITNITSCLTEKFSIARLEAIKLIFLTVEPFLNI